MARIPIDYEEGEMKQNSGETEETEKDSALLPEKSDASETGQKEKPGAGGETRDTADKEEPAEPEGRPEDMSEKAEALEKENAEYLDHLQRLKAEFENFKRRTNKEKADTIKFANSRMAERLLGVLDNLQRGLDYAADNPADEEILNGMRLVEKQLLDVLAEFGVTPFDSLGEDFDPNIHEPLYTLERTDVEENRIIEEIGKGYRIHDRILRVAKVAVSKKPEPKQDK